MWTFARLHGGCLVARRPSRRKECARDDTDHCYHKIGQVEVPMKRQPACPIEQHGEAEKAGQIPGHRGDLGMHNQLLLLRSGTDAASRIAGMVGDAFEPQRRGSDATGNTAAPPRPLASSASHREHRLLQASAAYDSVIPDLENIIRCTLVMRPLILGRGIKA